MASSNFRMHDGKEKVTCSDVNEHKDNVAVSGLNQDTDALG